MTETGWGICYLNLDGEQAVVRDNNPTGWGEVPLIWPYKRLARAHIRKLKGAMAPADAKTLIPVRIRLTVEFGPQLAGRKSA